MLNFESYLHIDMKLPKIGINEKNVIRFSIFCYFMRNRPLFWKFPIIFVLHFLKGLSFHTILGTKFEFFEFFYLFQNAFKVLKLPRKPE